MTYRLTLTENNTGQDTFTFYEEQDGENRYITQSVMELNQSIDLTINEEGDTFYITTPNGNDDFTFTSGSL
jgi:hypothetical protein